MPYPITFRGLDGGSYKAVIQHLEAANRFWDDAAGAWVSAINAGCELPLTEGSNKGFYTGSATLLTPIYGGLYRIVVFDNSDDEFEVTKTETFAPLDNAALAIVNAVQRKLRMPQTSAGNFATDPHAILILDFVNEVYLNLLPSKGISGQFKFKGSFVTKLDVSQYPLYPINEGYVDGIIQINHVIGSTSAIPLTEGTEILRIDDKAFKEYENGVSESGKPVYYRIFQWSNGIPIIEFTPVPDTGYIIQYEAIAKKSALSAATDIPHCDSRILILGATVLAKNEAGEDSSSESAQFQIAMDNCPDNDVGTMDIEV